LKKARRNRPGHDRDEQNARSADKPNLGTLGLEVLLEDEQFLTFRCGGNSRLIVTKSTTGTAEDATKASWRVADIASEVAELRAHGVEIQDFPELGTVDGIADIGFALAAWFTDPRQNSIGLLQFK